MHAAPRSGSSTHSTIDDNIDLRAASASEPAPAAPFNRLEKRVKK